MVETIQSSNNIHSVATTSQWHVRQEKRETTQTGQLETSARQDNARQDRTGQDTTRQDKTRQDNTGQDKARQDRTHRLTGWTDILCDNIPHMYT